MRNVYIIYIYIYIYIYYIIYVCPKLSSLPDSHIETDFHYKYIKNSNTNQAEHNQI